jgi:deoxyadenosine/deoxycytidine kinase
MADRNLLIVVDGPIGAGKTTVVGALARRSAAGGDMFVPIEEPITADEIRDQYEHPHENTFSFQCNVIRRKTALVEAEMAKPPDPGFVRRVVVLERSLAADRAFATLRQEYMTDKEFSDYDEAYWAAQTRLDAFKSKTRYFLINISPMVSLARIAIRGRLSEAKSVTLDYLEKLHDIYVTLYRCGSLFGTSFVIPGTIRPDQVVEAICDHI